MEKFAFAPLSFTVAKTLIKALETPQRQDFDDYISSALNVSDIPFDALRPTRNSVVKFMHEFREKHPEKDFDLYWEVVWLATGLIDEQIWRKGGQV